MVRAFVGMGGNVGGEAAVRARLAAAADAIGRLAGVVSVRVASCYRTRPLGPVAEQAPFVNSAALVEVTPRPPGDFLAALLGVEAAFGRDRTRERRQGPRTLDLDLLLWDDLVLREPGLDLPHPRLAQRAFALAPLVELAGADLVIPGPGGGRAGDLLAVALADPAQAVERLPT